MNQEDYPIDWDQLQVQRVDRDDGECVDCGQSRPLFVIYEDDPEDAGYGIDNLRTYCEQCVPDHEKSPMTRVSDETYDRVATGSPSGSFDTGIDIDGPPVNNETASATAEAPEEPEEPEVADPSTPMGKEAPEQTVEQVYTGDTYQFGKYVPYPYRLGLLAGALLVTGFVATVLASVGTALLQSPSAGFALAANWAMAGVDGVWTLVTSPALLTGVFAVTYLGHLIHRDYGDGVWPVMRERKTWKYTTENVLAAGLAGMTASTLGLGNAAFTTAIPSGIFGRELVFLVSLLGYTASAGYGILSMNTLVMRDLDELATPVRAFAWDFGMRVGSVAAIMGVLFGFGSDRMVVGLMLAPVVVGLAYIVRRRVGFRMPEPGETGSLAGGVPIREQIVFKASALWSRAKGYVRRIVRNDPKNNIE